MALIPVLGMMGVGLGLGGVVVAWLNPGQSTSTTTLLMEGAALLCLVAYVTGNWARLTTFSGSRSTRLGLNGITAIVVMAGILVIINFLAVRHGGRWDFSETQHFSLAPQTLRVLGQLTQDITVTVFARDGSQGFRTYRDLLDGYTYANPRMSVTYVDPDTEPARFRAYDVATVNAAVFENGTRAIHVTRPTEANLTNALIRVTHEQFKRLVFLEGHGERRVTNKEREGLSMAWDALKAQGYAVERGAFRDNPALLRHADVLIIPGPRQPLAASELRKIKRFVDDGGRLMALLDPHADTGVDTWMAPWGLTFGPGIVVDPTDRIAQGNPTALLVRRFTNHPITGDFTAPIVLPVSQPVTVNPSFSTTSTFTPLMQSSDDSWAETNVDPKIAPEYQEGRDRKGPFPLAGAVARRTDSPNADETNADETNTDGTPSLVVVGNAAFAGNAWFTFPGNRDFLLGAVAWLADESALMSAAPRDSSFAPFIPNPAQEHLLFAVQVFSVPFLILLLGVTVWRRRRRL